MITESFAILENLKVSTGIVVFDKAVALHRKGVFGKRKLLYIFQKDYGNAIVDMEMAEIEFGYGYQKDHSYPFYIIYVIYS